MSLFSIFCCLCNRTSITKRSCEHVRMYATYSLSPRKWSISCMSNTKKAKFELQYCMMRSTHNPRTLKVGGGLEIQEHFQLRSKSPVSLGYAKASFPRSLPPSHLEVSSWSILARDFHGRPCIWPQLRFSNLHTCVRIGPCCSNIYGIKPSNDSP